MITASVVKELRQISGAGMMDCKKALQEANGDTEKAMVILRKNGIAKAEKKAGRAASEGSIIPYIHPGSKLGVLLEINCETDFVARTEGFQDFCKDVAMHIAAACPLAVQKEDLDLELVEKEKEIYREQSEKSGKPAEIVEKMVEGRLKKFYQESVLMEQNFVKNPDLTIKDLLTETVATLGENVSIARFVRFQLGEMNPRTAEEQSDNE